MVASFIDRYDPSLAERAIAAFERVPDGPVRMQGGALRDAVLKVLIDAELLAVAAGIVPLASAGVSVLQVGLAHEYLAKAPAGVRSVYLAAYAAARDLHRGARDANLRTGDAPVAVLSLDAVGQMPQLLGLSVLGFAALAALAWYGAKSTEKVVEVMGETAQKAMRVNALTRLAMTYVDKGKAIPDSLIDAIKGDAARESLRDWIPLVQASCLLGATWLLVRGRPKYA